MSLRQRSILLPLLHWASLFTGAKTSPGSSVIQTPTFLNVLEGSTLNISCTFNGNITSKWILKWFHCKNGREVELKDLNPQISIMSERYSPFSRLILERADIDDAGIYQCRIGIGKSSNPTLYNNGTEVIINEITDLMVNQTPEHLDKLEGENVTIECNFRTLSNLSSMYVRWWKNMTELSDQIGTKYTITKDLERGFSSLTILNAEKSDSGVYKCQAGSSLRNRTGSGGGSYLVVTERTKKSDPEIANENAGTGFGLGSGAGAGIFLLLLLLLGISVWIYHKKKKKRAKGTPGVREDTEAVPTEEVKKHPPATNRASDVTYVDLNFHRREVQPATEVIYAEVRR